MTPVLPERGAFWKPAATGATVTDQVGADNLNAAFYGRIQYPPPALIFERVVDRGFWARMLAQDIGDWHEPFVREGSEIWVAGCGTNQALITALKFPEASVLGSDVSEQSLTVCERHAVQLGATNLCLRSESINNVEYSDRFDFIICTGVIHSNADPESTLKRLARALAPTGVLELMVYNQYHRIQTSAFQVALRTLVGTLSHPDIEAEFSTAQRLADTFDRPGAMSAFLAGCRGAPFAHFADALLQPIEHSFTVASLRDIASRCGLELLTFAVDQHSQAQNTTDWNMSFRDPQLQAQYDALPDTDRWQITNSLSLDRSPMLWFYLQRRDSPRQRRSEQDLCSDFLNLRFSRTHTHKDIFKRRADGSYSTTPRRIAFPLAKPIDGPAARLYEVLDERSAISQSIGSIGLDLSFKTIHSLRVHLATTAYPFLAVA